MESALLGLVWIWIEREREREREREEDVGIIWWKPKARQ
jgi:hypothetical protein